MTEELNLNANCARQNTKLLKKILLYGRIRQNAPCGKTYFAFY